MEASVNASSAVTTASPSGSRAPAPPTAAPVAPARPLPRRRNWGVVVRVGVVVALVLALLGYALQVTYESVIKGGVVSAGDHFKVELKQMSNFEMDQVLGGPLDVPERFRQLDGKRVVLEGEVAPGGMFSGDSVKQFSLCYSVAKCCFGGPPKVQHFVACRARDGKPMPNYEGNGAVRVYGTLHVKAIKNNETGKLESIFQLDVDRLESAA